MDADDNNIIIISKEGESIEFDKRITGFCDGLSIYDFSEEIDLSKTASSSFLKTIKEFYEQNEFDAEKLKVKERITGNKLEENLISKINTELMQPFFDKAQEKKQMDQLLDLQFGAELLQSSEFLNLVTCTIATLVYCPESEAEQKEYAQKWDLDDKQPEEMIEDLQQEPELLEAWKELDANLCRQFQEKLNELLNPAEDNNNNAQPAAAGGFGAPGGFGMGRGGGMFN